MTIGEKIKNARIKAGLSVDEVADKLGKDRTTIYRYESSYIEKLPLQTLEPLAKILHTTPARLMGWDETPSNITEIGADDIATYNVVGRIAAGYDGAAIEEYTGEVIQIPRSLLHGIDPKRFFALRIKGDSMYPRLLDGDCVLILKTESVDSGSIAAVLYNGDEATLKEVRYVPGENWMELIPANPEFKAKRIEGADLQQCRVLGKAFKLIRDI